MYSVWRVYEQTGEKFYVVNLATKRVQSSWKSILEATAVCEKLNYLNEKGAC